MLHRLISESFVELVQKLLSEVMNDIEREKIGRKSSEFKIGNLGKLYTRYNQKLTGRNLNLADRT